MPILLVKVASSDVPDAPGRWRSGEVVGVFPDDHVFGGKEVPEAGKFYHVGVTDRTLEQVQNYMDGWNHNPSTSQIGNQGNRRLIEVTSSAVSATGKNAFTRDGVQALFDEINAEYPTADMQYDSHTQNSFRFRITAPMSARDELIDRINAAVREMQYARRRWYITQSGMTYLANNGGTVSGTAGQVAGYIRDGLLD